MIDEDLDLALDRLARERGTSKAALIREFVRERIQPMSPVTGDSLWTMVGIDDYEPGSVDDVVYR
jgi:hypothetical protein